MGVQGVCEEMAAGFKALGDKVNRSGERESALEHKLEGHEERMMTLDASLPDTCAFPMSRCKSHLFVTVSRGNSQMSSLTVCRFRQ